MKHLITLLLLCISSLAFAQQIDKEKLIEAKKNLTEGNKLYKAGKLDEAVASYEKGLQENTTYYQGAYNLGTTYFRQEKYKEASDQYALANKLAKTKEEKSRTKELMGDSFIAQQDLENAEKSYKEALLKSPNNDVLRQKYVATKQAKQQQDQQNQDNKDQDKDNKDDKNEDKKDEKNKDNKDQDKENNEDKKDDKGEDKEDKKDGDKKENEDNKDKKDENGEKDNKKGEGDNKEQQPKPKESKLSPEQIKQLLESMSNEEQKTQEKVNVQKVKAKVNNNEKDW